MKKSFLYTVAMTLIILAAVTGCGKSASVTGRFAAPITKTAGEVIYDQKGDETAITGKVVVINGSLMRQLVELGSAENGKLNLAFPEVPAPGELQRPDWFYSEGPGDFNVPGVKIEPEGANWMYLNEQKPIYILTDEETEGMFGSVDKVSYQLELQCEPETITARFIYFPQDTSITAKGKQDPFIWDIDIKGRKGWNLLYTSSDDRSLTIRSSGKEVTDIKWIAVKSKLGVLF